MKNLFFIVLIIAAGFLPSCDRCMECTDDNWYRVVWDTNNNSVYETPYISEVCRDDFESKEAFEKYIEAFNESQGTCVSDFGN